MRLSLSLSAISAYTLCQIQLKLEFCEVRGLSCTDPGSWQLVTGNWQRQAQPQPQPQLSIIVFRDNFAMSRISFKCRQMANGLKNDSRSPRLVLWKFTSSSRAHLLSCRLMKIQFDWRTLKLNLIFTLKFAGSCS